MSQSCWHGGLFLLAIRRIAQPNGWGWLIPVLAFPAMFWNLGVGQNAFLTASLFAGFTLMLDRRPATAGAMLGLLCYKPHYGLLALFALAAGQRWRARDPGRCCRHNGPAQRDQGPCPLHNAIRQNATSQTKCSIACDKASVSALSGTWVCPMRLGLLPAQKWLARP